MFDNSSGTKSIRCHIWIHIPLFKSSSEEEKTKKLGIKLSMSMLVYESPCHHLRDLVQFDPVVDLGPVQLKMGSHADLKVHLMGVMEPQVCMTYQQGNYLSL